MKETIVDSEPAAAIKSSGDVFCFGEILLRMSPVLGGQWIQQSSLPVYIGGAELNVATALANWHIPVKYCTAMPDNYLTEEIITALQSKKINTSAVQITGNRIGVYYLPQGSDLKHAGVIYDRANSSFASLQPGTINWDKVLEGCSWFHFSAISPALNKNIALLCKEALIAASAKGLKISVDLNYRAKLWQYGVEPEAVMKELVNYCHVIMGNIWAVESLLGIQSPLENSIDKTNEALTAAAGISMLALHKQYPQAETLAYTFRLAHHYWGVLQHGTEMRVSKQFPIQQVVDKVGSGDCFMAGLIYGLYHQQIPQHIINYAAAAAFGKLYETGDATQQTIEQVKEKI